MSDLLEKVKQKLEANTQQHTKDWVSATLGDLANPIQREQPKATPQAKPQQAKVEQPQEQGFLDRYVQASQSGGWGAVDKFGKAYDDLTKRKGWDLKSVGDVVSSGLNATMGLALGAGSVPIGAISTATELAGDVFGKHAKNTLESILNLPNEGAKLLDKGFNAVGLDVSDKNLGIEGDFTNTVKEATNFGSIALMFGAGHKALKGETTVAEQMAMDKKTNAKLFKEGKLNIDGNTEVIRNVRGAKRKARLEKARLRDIEKPVINIDQSTVADLPNLDKFGGDKGVRARNVEKVKTDVKKGYSPTTEPMIDLKGSDKTADVSSKKKVEGVPVRESYNVKDVKSDPSDLNTSRVTNVTEKFVEPEVKTEAPKIDRERFHAEGNAIQTESAKLYMQNKKGEITPEQYKIEKAKLDERTAKLNEDRKQAEAPKIEAKNQAKLDEIKAKNGSKTPEIVKAKNEVKIELDTKTQQIRADKNHYPYKVLNGNGKEIGNIALNYREDLGGYQIENVKISPSREGYGYELYKNLIKDLDKPLISDPSLTAQAKGLWEKLVRDGLAENIGDRYKSITDKPEQPKAIQEKVPELRKLTDIDKPLEKIQTTPEIDTKVNEVIKNRTTNPTIERLKAEAKAEVKNSPEVDQAYKNIQEKSLGRTNMFGDPTIIKDYVVVAKDFIQKGIKTFKEFAQKMIKQFGNGIKIKLRNIWDEANKVQPQGAKKPATLGINPSKANKHIADYIVKVADNFASEFESMKGERLTDAQLKRAAINKAKVMTDSEVLSLQRGSTGNATQILATRIYANARMNEIMVKAKNGEYKSQPQKHFELAKATKMILKAEALKSESGRALRQSKIRITDEMMGMKDLADIIEDINPEAAKKIRNIIKDVKDPTMADKASFWFYNSILSSPLTDVANVIGNGTMLGTEIFTRMISQSPKETMVMLKAIGRGHKNGIADIKKIYWGEKAISSKFMSGEDIRGFDVKPKAKAGRVGRAVLPTTRLAIEDAYFRALSHSMELETTKARLADKYKTPNPEQVIKDILDGKELLDPNSKHYQDALFNAEKYADYMTFQVELGKAGKAMQTLTDKALPLKLIVPFVRTPANILKAGLHATPLGLGKLFKNIPEAEKPHIIRRAMAGTIVLTTLGKMMGDGKIEVTGSGPKNPKERATWEAMGYKPNHIYFGDTGYSYQNVNPWNIPLALIGNLSDQIKYQKEDRDWSQLASESLAGMAETMSDQSFMQGLSKLIAWMDGRNPNYLKDLPQTFIPNIISTPKNIIEYINGEKPMYEADTFEERTKRRAGITKDLVPSYDAFGKPRQSGYERFPFNPATLSDDPLLKILRDKKVEVSRPGKTTKWGDKTMADFPEIYAEYTKLSGQYLTEYLKKYKDRFTRLNNEQLQEFVDRLSRNARKRAKNDLRKRDK